VRLGRKATDQVNNLRAGLPKRGVVDLKGVGSQVEELRPYAEDPVFLKTSPNSLCPGNSGLAYSYGVFSATGEGCWAVECPL